MAGKVVAKWKLAAALGLLSLAGLALLAKHGLDEARAMPLIRRVTVEFPALPASQRPISVALLSDIHIGNRSTPPERLERIVAAVNAARPDAILIAGDFVNGDRRGDPAAKPALLPAPLAKLHAPMGVIATLGNHDHYTNARAVRRALQQAGITVLQNDAMRLGPFVLVGIDDGSSDHENVPVSLRRAQRLGGIPVAITHSPVVGPYLASHIPLLLVAHTHCGQAVVQLGDYRFYPTELIFGRPYPKTMRCGIGRTGDMLSVVSGGIGTSNVPMRFNAPPDWWLITLAPVARAETGGAISPAVRNGSAAGR